MNYGEAVETVKGGARLKYLGEDLVSILPLRSDSLLMGPLVASLPCPVLSTMMPCLGPKAMEPAKLYSFGVCMANTSFLL